MKEKATLVALVGHPRSGKSTLARALQEKHGFTVISGSEILRRSLSAQQDIKKLVSREDYDSYHRQWRKEHGLSAMAKFVMGLSDGIAGPKRVCFENLRNKYDAVAIQEAGGVIVAIECPIEVRFERSKMFFDQKDNLDMASFQEAEEAEYASDDPFGSHVEDVIKMANIVIDGSRSKELVYADLASRLNL